MNKILRYARLIVPAVAAIFFAPAALAVTCTSTGTGNWNNPGIWSCGVVPGAGAGDIVTISAGNTVTLNISPANPIATLTVNGTGTLNVGGFTFTVSGATNVSGTLAHVTSAAGTKTYIGLVTINPGGAWNNAINEAVTFRGGITNNGTFTGGTATQTFNTNSQAIGGTSPINFGGAVTVSGAITVTNNNTSTVTIAGTLNGSAAGSTWVNAANSTLNYSNAGSTAAPMATRVLTATAAGNTVNYTRAGAQTVKATTYSNLTLSGTSAKTTTGVTVNGILSMEGTATASAAPTYGASATLQYNTATARPAGVEWRTPFAATGGIIITNTGAITMNSAEVLGASVPLTINAGATLNTGNFQLTFGGDFINNGGTFTAGSSPIVIANTMAAQSLDGFTTTGLVSMTKTAGTATFAGNVNAAGLTISGAGGTLNLGAGLTHTVTGAWTTTAGALDGGSSTLNIGGSCSVPPPGATFTAGAGTVNWNAAGAQTVCQYAYNNLGLSNSGAKTMTGVTTITGDLNISGAATMTGNAAFTVGGALNYSSTGTTTLNAATPISIGSFNQTAGTITAGANTVTVSGNWNETGTFTSTGTVTFNGAAAQTISGTSPVTFSTLNVTNAASPNITLAATNVTVTTLTGTATLTPSCPDYTLTSVTPAQVLHSCPTVVNSINRANPDPTSAATVSWTVTFNQSVTGVDATAFTLVPSGVSGAYITTVAGSGTTWTVTANTGIGSGTLRLDQTGPGSVVPPLSGTFTTGQFYTITATPALAEYRMDEASWNGTAGEVVDSSGSGNHAQAFNSASTAGTTPAIATNPGTCRYGVFDNGGTITQGYVQTPLPDLTTDFTFAAWIRTTNNAATGQRILIDDQNNTGGYGLSLGDGAAGILRFYSRGITPVILDSTYTIANNTWYFVAAVADITNKKRTLYVFDTAGALLNSTTEAAWTGGAWGTDAGPVSIGGEVNGPPQTEPPATFHFRGNLDEVRVYQKVLSQAALAAIAAQTHACPIVTADHFAISHSGTGVTCQAEPITITAHDALHNIFTAQAASIMLSTSTGKGDWSLIAGGGTLTPGAVNSGSAVYAFAAGDNGQVTLGLKHTAAGSVSLGVTDGTATLTTGTGAGEADPPVVYSDAGFSVTDNAGNPVNIGNQVAGQTSGTLYLQAVKTAPNGACTGVFNTTVNIEMAAQCNNPVACAGKQVTVNATALNVGITNATVVPPSGVAGVNVPLAFGANSIAPFTLNYPDVGRIKLYARYNMPLRDGTPSGNYMVGNSNPFVVKPGGFALSGIKRTSDSFANPAAVNATGAKFVKAGEQFTATVTATTIDGVTATPNFGQETNPEPAESVKLTPTLAAGLGLTNNPAINGTFGAFANGIATGAAFTWNEVGIITLTPSVLSANYLGAGDATGAVSGTVGRFYAAMFGLTAGSITNRADVACPTCTWTYMGEQMNAAFTLTAKAADGATTLQNYNYSATSANNFAKLDPTAAGNPLLFGAVNSTATPTYLTARLDTSLPATGNFVNGNGTANVVAPLAITRSASADGPYALLDIGIAPQDSDGALMAAYNLDTDAVAGNDHTTVARSEVRYGRMKVSNAHGSELLTLPIGVTVQYWDGTNYVTSATDSLTTFASTNVVFANWQKNLTAGSTTASPASVVFANGVGSFNLSAPGAGKNGSVDLTTNAPSYLPSNTARATFGVYKGNNNFIYLRESY